ncbi:hypothetical protein JOD25_001723 [Kurthia huakuii]|nr:hypothetical protein [Kurthia huakuii]
MGVVQSKLYDSQFSLVMSEIIGQLDYLRQQQLITARLQDGVYLFEQNRG